MYCVGCGEPLRVHAGRCPSCRTPVSGARFEEEVAVEYGQGIVVPPVCCCCLAPRDGERREEISSVSFFTLEKKYTKIPLPWCGSCRQRRSGFGWLSLATFLAAAVCLYLVLPGSWEMAGALAAAAGGALAGALATPLHRRIFPTLEIPGHVPGCDAVSGGVESERARLVFHNRAFARIWQELNAGVPSQAPAMRWAEGKPAIGKPVPRASQPHSTIETRARVRDQLQAGKPSPLARTSFGTRPVGADAAAEVLGFSLKTLQIAEEGLEATERTGARRKVAFTDIARVISRKLPDGLPFSGAIFVDLIPSAGGPPIRLLPTTRANYGALPGSGSTSHENYRRLVRHLKARNPAVAIDPGSVPYLEEGKGFPPALDTTDAIAEYESGFAALREGR